MRFSLKKTEIQQLLAQKTDLKTRTFFLKSRQNVVGEGRVAFVISKRWGNAVWRNRVKRRIREVIRHACSGGQGSDVVCIVHRPLKELTERDWRHEREKIKNWCESF